MKKEKRETSLKEYKRYVKTEQPVQTEKTVEKPDSSESSKEEEKTKQDKFKEACPESAKELEKILTEPNSIPKIETPVEMSVEDILTDPVYQRGSGYRAEKLKGIWKARQQNMSNEKITKLLLRGGLTRQTANVMMKDSRVAYE